MVIIFIGATITIVGSVMTAIGTYLHNKSSSEKSTRIDEGVAHLKQENLELKSKANELLKSQTDLKSQLDPFIDYAIKAYPNLELKDALTKAQQDIATLEEKLAATAEMAKPVELVYDSFEVIRKETYYRIVITLSTTKHAQLGELEFTVTLENMDGPAQIIKLEPVAEEGSYQIFGAFYENYSTNRKQAKCKYSPASIVRHPKLVVVTNQLDNLFIEGNYNLERTRIQVR